MTFLKAKTKELLGILFVIFLLAGVSTIAKAQQPPKISVYCAGDEVGVSFSDWLPNETLTAQADGDEVGQITTAEDGSGAYIFSAGVTNIALVRVNGDVLVVGEADCSQPPVGEIADVNPYQVVLPLGSSAQLSATGADETGNAVELPLIWVTESGSITADGKFTATEEGNFTIMAVHVGTASSFSYQIAATVTPPIASLEVVNNEIFVFAGQTSLLEILALDGEGNPLDVALAWELGGAGEIVAPNLFLAGEETGDFILSGGITGTDLHVEITVHIIPFVESIQIEPNIDEIAVGETQEFRVVALDSEGNEVSLPIDPIWTAEIGGINASGVYTATTEGEETISAILDLSEIQAHLPGQGVLASDDIPSGEEQFSVTAQIDETVGGLKRLVRYCGGGFIAPAFLWLVLVLIGKRSLF